MLRGFFEYNAPGGDVAAAAPMEVNVLDGVVDADDADIAEAAKEAAPAGVKKVAGKVNKSQLQGLPPSTVEIVRRAEQAVQAAVDQVAAMARMSGAVSVDAWDVVKEHQALSSSAATSMTAARRELRRQTVAARRMVREAALRDIEDLQDRLAIAQERLPPLRAARSSFEESIAGATSGTEGALSDVWELLGNVEAELLRASEMKKPEGDIFADDGPLPTEGLAEHEECVALATQSLKQAEQSLASRIKSVTHKSLRAALSHLQERAQLMRRRHKEAEAALQLRRDEVVGRKILRKAKLHAEAVSFVAKLGEEETERATREGALNDPDNNVHEYLQAAEDITAKSELVAEELVIEQRALHRDVAKRVSRQLEETQRRIDRDSQTIDVHTRFAQLRQQKKRVAEVEERVQAVSEAAKYMSSDTELGEVEPERVRATLAAIEAAAKDVEAGASEAKGLLRSGGKVRDGDSPAAQEARRCRSLRVRLQTALDSFKTLQSAACVVEKVLRRKDELAEDDLRIDKLEASMPADHRVAPPSESAVERVFAGLTLEQVQKDPLLFEERYDEVKHDLATRERHANRILEEERLRKAEAGIEEEVQAFVDELEEGMEGLREAMKPLEEFLESNTPSSEHPEALHAATAAASTVEALLQSAQSALAKHPASDDEAKPKGEAIMALSKTVEEHATSFHEMSSMLSRAGTSMYNTLTEDFSTALLMEADRQKAPCSEFLDELVEAVSTEESAGNGLAPLSADVLASIAPCIPDLNISKEECDFLFNRLAKGEDAISRFDFLAVVQRFYVAVKDVPLTTQFDVGPGDKPQRKIENGELLEALEGPPRPDTKRNMTRLRARAMSDGMEGWITMRGGQGTIFLERVEKPVYTCMRESVLEPEVPGGGAKDVNGTDKRLLRVGEVLEHLAGPREQQAVAKFRYTEVTLPRPDGDNGVVEPLHGWLVLQDAQGTAYVDTAGFYEVARPIAITDQAELKTCKPLRKVEATEVIQVLEGPNDAANPGTLRLRGRVLLDNVEGWITVKGSAGTVFASPSQRQGIMLRDAALYRTPAAITGTADGAQEEVCRLAKHDVVIFAREPVEVAAPPVLRVKVRACEDGAGGWVALEDGNLVSELDAKRRARNLPKPPAAPPPQALLTRRAPGDAPRPQTTPRAGGSHREPSRLSAARRGEGDDSRASRPTAPPTLARRQQESSADPRLRAAGQQASPVQRMRVTASRGGTQRIAPAAGARASGREGQAPPAPASIPCSRWERSRSRSRRGARR